MSGGVTHTYIEKENRKILNEKYSKSGCAVLEPLLMGFDTK